MTIDQKKLPANIVQAAWNRISKFSTDFLNHLTVLFSWHSFASSLLSIVPDAKGVHVDSIVLGQYRWECLADERKTQFEQQARLNRVDIMAAFCIKNQSLCY